MLHECDVRHLLEVKQREAGHGRIRARSERKYLDRHGRTLGSSSK
jgi:hypothetical protein